MTIFGLIGAKLPILYRKNINALLSYIKSKTSSDEFSGKVFIFSIISSVGLTFLSNFLGVPWYLLIPISVLGFLAVQLATYLILIVVADKRAREIENYLPDVLTLMSANLRAGMTMDKAIWSVVRPEFGPLEEELNELGKDVVGGTPFSEALYKMGSRSNSEIVRQTVRLIDEGIKSGGELESLLHEIAQDIRSMEKLKEEIKANIAMYVLFMLFASAIAAPMLFGMSTKLIDVSAKIQTPVDATQAVSIPGMPISFTYQKKYIDSNQIYAFFIAEIVMITIFASLVMGLIQEGNEKRGLKFIPALMAIGLSAFFISRVLLSLILFI